MAYAESCAEAFQEAKEVILASLRTDPRPDGKDASALTTLFECSGRLGEPVGQSAARWMLITATAYESRGDAPHAALVMKSVVRGPLEHWMSEAAIVDHLIGPGPTGGRNSAWNLALTWCTQIKHEGDEFHCRMAAYRGLFDRAQSLTPVPDLQGPAELYELAAERAPDQATRVAALQHGALEWRASGNALRAEQLEQKARDAVATPTP